MYFNDKLKEYTDLINKNLLDLIEVPSNAQKTIYEAMRYSLMAGGKRIRPVLTLSVCEMLGGNLEDAMAFALAIECIHTYSLIHDDLPCMDDDDLRRGNPTCHKVYGYANALLAGDALLNIAFEIMSDSSRYKEITSDTTISIIKEISVSSGANGMIGGQAVDLLNEKRKDVSLDELIYMHEKKTGVLIKASAVTGALVANADLNEIRKIYDFSYKLGLAFQIKDDILDCIGNGEVLGKPIGSDIQNCKTTFVSILGVERAKEYLSDLTKDAIEELSCFGDRAEFLIELSEYLLERNY